MILTLVSFGLFLFFTFLIWNLAGLMRENNLTKPSYLPDRDIKWMIGYFSVAWAFAMLAVNTFHAHLVGSIASLEANAIAVAVVLVLECIVAAIGASGVTVEE